MKVTQRRQSRWGSRRRRGAGDVRRTRTRVQEKRRWRKTTRQGGRRKQHMQCGHGGGWQGMQAAQARPGCSGENIHRRDRQPGCTELHAFGMSLSGQAGGSAGGGRCRKEEGGAGGATAAATAAWAGGIAIDPLLAPSRVSASPQPYRPCLVPSQGLADTTKSKVTKIINKKKICIHIYIYIYIYREIYTERALYKDNPTFGGRISM